MDVVSEEGSNNSPNKQGAKLKYFTDTDSGEEGYTGLKIYSRYGLCEECSKVELGDLYNKPVEQGKVQIIRVLGEEKALLQDWLVQTCPDFAFSKFEE
jgi:hypothetical protein